MSLFDTVGGLPAHPLVVHLAVVMLPLATFALLAIILVPRWRASHGWLTMTGLCVGALGAVLAAQTGEELANHVGLPQDHARWGDLLEKAALVLLVVAFFWFLLQRRTAARAPGSTRRVLDSPAQTLAAVLSIVMALGVLTLTVVVGHSGAAAVWEGRAASTPSVDTSRQDAPVVPPSAASTAPPRASTSPTPLPSSGAITILEVQQHATVASCWSVVDEGVYDLTDWIPRHPGGASVIKAMCGKDASRAFHKEHGTRKEPNTVLSEFSIGALSK